MRVLEVNKVPENEKVNIRQPPFGIFTLEVTPMLGAHTEGGRPGAPSFFMLIH